MRAVEALSFLVIGLAFLVWVAPLPGTVRRVRRWAPIVLLMMGIQMLAQSSRRQMDPVSAVAGLFLAVGLLNSGLPARRWKNWFAFNLGLGLGVLQQAASRVLPAFRFPRPSGPYQVSMLAYHWIDADRADVLAADPDARRELMVQIFYPAEESLSSPPAPYLPDAEVVQQALVQLFHFPAFFLGRLKRMTTNAMPSAPVAHKEPSYPVVIFLEGLGGFRQMNTFQVEELVSHGYIVAAIDQPYAAAAVVFPDGRRAIGLPILPLKAQLRPSLNPAETAPPLHGRVLESGITPYLAQDAIFVLDQLGALNQADPNGILTRRLDLQRTGLLGVSLGGIVGGEVSRLDPRVRACLLMDAPMTAGVVQDGLQQPGMWITRDAQTMQLEGWPQAEIDEHQTTMRAAFENLAGDGYFVQVPKMFHINFTDAPYWSPLVAQIGIAGPIDARRAHSILNAYSVAFFDQHLKGRSAALLDGPAEGYPEVLFEKRRP